MQITIPYSRDFVVVDIPERNFGEIVYPNEVDKHDQLEVLENALDNPVDSKPFDEFLSDAKDVLFLVNDATRPTPTAKVLSLIYDKIKDQNISFLVATGAHRAPTEEEYLEIFGDIYHEFKDRIFAHDAKHDEMVSLGTSQNGTVMEVNKRAMNAHKIIIIGSVEPHYFAGYTGGRKSFLPGVAAYKTIEMNHKLALKSDAKALALKGNPVHEDMEDAINLVKHKEIFAIMTVLDRNEDIYAATAGDITGSFDAAIDKAHEVFVVEVKEKYDIVVAVAPYPMDIDLYQSQKALDNAKLALDHGGILILVSKCRMGTGSETFINLMAGSKNHEDALHQIDQGYKLGYHKAAKMAEMARWSKMWAVTSLSPDIIRSVFIKPFSSIKEAINAAIKEKGNEKILFLMAASMTVPKERKRLVHRTKRFIHNTSDWQTEEIPMVWELEEPEEKKEPIEVPFDR